jgi:hypothetical protein
MMNYLKPDVNIRKKKIVDHHCLCTAAQSSNGYWLKLISTSERLLGEDMPISK